MPPDRMSRSVSYLTWSSVLVTCLALVLSVCLTLIGIGVLTSKNSDEKGLLLALSRANCGTHISLTQQFNERGYLIGSATFDVGGKPWLDENGVAKATFKYDELGSLIEEAYFDIDGKPCLNINGIAKITFKYDERGNLVEPNRSNLVRY